MTAPNPNQEKGIRLGGFRPIVGGIRPATEPEPLHGDGECLWCAGYRPQAEKPRNGRNGPSGVTANAAEHAGNNPAKPPASRAAPEIARRMPCGFFRHNEEQRGTSDRVATTTSRNSPSAASGRGSDGQRE